MTKQKIPSVLIALITVIAYHSLAFSQQKPIVLMANTVIDGSGEVLHHTSILVEGSTIQRIGGPIPPGALVYNLGSLTVTPGLIDTHEHILWHFDNGRLSGNDENPLQAILHGVDNACGNAGRGVHHDPESGLAGGQVPARRTRPPASRRDQES